MSESSSFVFLPGRDQYFSFDSQLQIMDYQKIMGLARNAGAAAHFQQPHWRGPLLSDNNKTSVAEEGYEIPINAMVGETVAKVREIADRHGPGVFLGGFSLGGNIAIRAANELIINYSEVDVLGVIACSPSIYFGDSFADKFYNETDYTAITKAEMSETLFPTLDVPTLLIAGIQEVEPIQTMREQIEGNWPDVTSLRPDEAHKLFGPHYMGELEEHLGPFIERNTIA